MTTAVVLLAMLVIVLVGVARGGEPYEPPSREQLLRDEEDIALYGAIVRPPLDEDDDDRPRGR